jgi:hypothetical protein
VKSRGTVEFLAGADTLDRWLTRSSDTIIVRISKDSVALLLTSVRLPTSSVLTVNVQRIDTEPNSAAPVLSSGVLHPHILAHIENFGDIYFNDGRAGFSGQNLWIEAFAITSLGDFDPGSIEYCGVTVDRFQTPWLSNQILCGSRGRGIPLIGYAIRLKPDLAALYDCTYFGRFAAGGTLGPFKNGELCRSNVPGDPLEGIELLVAERLVSQPETALQEVQHSSVS